MHVLVAELFLKALFDRIFNGLNRRAAQVRPVGATPPCLYRGAVFQAGERAMQPLRTQKIELFDLRTACLVLSKGTNVVPVTFKCALIKSLQCSIGKSCRIDGGLKCAYVVDMRPNLKSNLPNLRLMAFAVATLLCGIVAIGLLRSLN